MEIESRKDKDHFFESLGGWNQDDGLGRKFINKERKLRKKEEKEARLVLKKQRQENNQMVNLNNELLKKPNYLKLPSGAE